MVAEYNNTIAKHGLGRRPVSYMVAKDEDRIRIEFPDHVFEWKVFKAVPEDA